MEGIFIKKKNNIWSILMLWCGIFLAVLYVGLKMVDAEATDGLITLLVLGVCCGLVAVPSMLLNRDAYIRVENGTVKAKYHWFGKLDCTIAEIAFVLPQVNMLTILLKSGKRHVIMGIANAWSVAATIRKEGYRVEEEAPDVIRAEMARAQAARKKTLLWVLGGAILIFANIFIAVGLTGGRDMPVFTKTDWVIFAAMSVVELATVVVLFFLADRCGKQQLPIEQLKYRLRNGAIFTYPMPNNKVVAVYADVNGGGRIVVCGFPNDASVYYYIQEVVGNYELETIHTSEIYDSPEELPEEIFTWLVDITDRL